jgi:hypothetical protein
MKNTFIAIVCAGLIGTASLFTPVVQAQTADEINKKMDAIRERNKDLNAWSQRRAAERGGQSGNTTGTTSPQGGAPAGQNQAHNNIPARPAKTALATSQFGQLTVALISCERIAQLSDSVKCDFTATNKSANDSVFELSRISFTNPEGIKLMYLPTDFLKGINLPGKHTVDFSAQLPKYFSGKVVPNIDVANKANKVSFTNIPIN